MRIFKLFKGHGLAVLAILVLLVGQAFCDLALPTYTANLVDVGIQQSGVENASTTVMTADTFDAVALLASDEGESLLRSSYDKGSDGMYYLNDFGRSHRATLDHDIAFPLVMANALETGQVPADTASVDLPALEKAYASGAVTKQQITDQVDALRSSLGIQDDILTQQALAAAVAEYGRAGVDVSQVQFDYLIRTGLTMMGFVAAGVAISIIVGFLASRTGAQIGRSLRTRFFRRVVAFSDAEIQRFSAASLITRGTNDIQQIQMMTIMALRMIIYAPILAIGGIFMVVQTNVTLSWTIVVGVVAVFIVVGVLFAVAMPKFRIMQKLIDKVNLIAREMLTGISVVRAFGRQEHEQKRFEKASRDLMGTQLFTNRVMTFMMPTMMLVMNAVSVLIVYAGGHAIDAGTLQTGDLIAFISYSMVIISSFLIIGMLAIIIPRAEVSAQRIQEVLDTEPSIVDPAESEEVPVAAEAAPGAEIKFDHVCFKYTGSVEQVLDDVTFTAEAGKTTAIIGPTGSGKSTVVKLIERLYDVTGGSVAVDGVDVRRMTQAHLRTQLGYVPQQAFLMSGTIASNVGYAENVADNGAEVTPEQEERIRRALSIAQAAQFVSEREEGIDTPIAQGGTNVSGGQRQRLAIARAVATDARAYLFDDSLSALDYKTDAALRQALATQMKGKTVVIVAQRIATVMNADKIIVLDEGRVVGQGTHDELMAACETYREIAYSQLSAAELEGGDAA